MLPVYLKFITYLNLAVIFGIALYLAFSKNTDYENSDLENFSKNYKIK